MPTTTQGPKRKYVRANTVRVARPDCPGCAEARADVDRIKAAAVRCVEDADAVIVALSAENFRLRAVVAHLTAQVTRDQDAAQQARRAD